MRIALFVSALLVVPAMALGASISVTSGGAAAVDVEPGVPISLAIEVNLDVPPMGSWDAALAGSRAGYAVSDRAPGAPFSNAAAWWALDFGAFGDPQPLTTPSIGYLKASVGDVAHSGVAVTFTLNGPALAEDEVLTISLVAPDGSALFYSPQSGPLDFDEVGALTITAIPEPASLLLLGLGGLFLRRRRA